MVLVLTYRRRSPRRYTVHREGHPIGQVWHVPPYTGRPRWRHAYSRQTYRTRHEAAVALLCARDAAHGVTLPASAMPADFDAWATQNRAAIAAMTPEELEVGEKLLLKMSSTLYDPFEEDEGDAAGDIVTG